MVPLSTAIVGAAAAEVMSRRRMVLCASMSPRIAPLLLVAILGCGRSTPPGGAEHRAPANDAVAAVVPPLPRDAVADAAAIVAAVPDASPPRARGEYCSNDRDCDWDDPCMAERCQRAPAKPLGCDKSGPPPGTCSCVENQCTLKSNDTTRGVSAPGCKTDNECAVDVGGATCLLGGETLIGPIHQQGPVCTCDAASTRCQWSYVGPVACESWRDCSWIRKPRLRPVPSRLVPRPFAKPVRACKDGEIDSVCTNKVCTIVGWSC